MAWKKGESGNPKGPVAGRTPRAAFENALRSAAYERAEEIIRRLIDDAIAGNERQMATLMNKLVANIDRHEMEAGAVPTRIVLEFAKPAKETDDGPAG